MPNRKKTIVRIISIGLISALFAGVFLNSKTKVVHAKDVFLCVQSIRDDNLDDSTETFTILEIVDKVSSYEIEDGNGNFLIEANGTFKEGAFIDLGEEEIGYLIGGEEPFQNIYKELIRYSRGYSNVALNQPLVEAQKKNLDAIKSIYEKMIAAIREKYPDIFAENGYLALAGANSSEIISYEPNPQEYDNYLRFVDDSTVTSGYMVPDDNGVYVGVYDPNDPSKLSKFTYAGDAGTPSLLLDWNLEEENGEKETVSENSTTKDETVEDVSGNSVQKGEASEEGADDEENVDDNENNDETENGAEVENKDKTETGEGTDSNENPADPNVTPTNPEETPSNPDETSSNTTETTTDSSTTSTETTITTETTSTTIEDDTTPQSTDDENVDDQVSLNYRREVVYGKQHVMMAEMSDAPQRYRFEPSEPSEPYYKVTTNVNQNSGTDEILIDAIYEFRFVGIKNNEWFKNHVFGLEAEPENDEISADRMKVEVVTCTPNDSELAEKIASADLVYWNADLTYKENDNTVTGADISVENAVTLLERITALEDLPCIVNDNAYKTLNPTGEAVINSITNSITNKLIYLLYQEDVKASFEDTSYQFNVATTWETSITAGPWKSIGDLISNSTTSDESIYWNNGHFVRDNVYVIDHPICDANKGLDIEITSTATDEEVAKAFDAVIYRIEQEKYERQQKGAMTWDDTTITPALAIQTILTYSGIPPVIEKSHIRVLELQPCYSFDYAGKNVEVFKEDFLPNGKESTVNVEIIGMTTAEFCGKLDDINVEYDMIYFGSNTDLMNRVNVADGATPDYCTVYNDFHMYGIVYSHIGDLCHINHHGGLIQKESNTYRYSGNDILAEQEGDLLSFLQSKAPIVLEDDFFIKDADNHVTAISSGSLNTTVKDNAKGVEGITRNGILDSSTYIYQFLKKACANEGIEYGDGGWTWENRVNKNLLLVSDLEKSNGKVEFSKWLNQPKMSIHVLSQPTEYNYTTKQIGNVSVIADSSYLQKEENEYYLEYEFYISNIASVNVQNTFYEVSLFIDTNMDGKFSSTTEDLSGSHFHVVDTSTGQEVSRNRLKAGVHYQVKRVLPYDAVGAIPWKLVVSNTDNSAIRSGIEGMTAVRASEKQSIKILQLFDNSDANKAKANIQESMKNPDSKWSVLLENVPDFEIDITSIDARQYFNGTLTEDLNNYDMLIVGFADLYQNQNGNGFDSNRLKAVVDYANSGKCVLFSHDNTNWKNEASTQDNTLNMHIRDLTGLDRYGVTVFRTTNKDAYKDNNKIKNGENINLNTTSGSTKESRQAFFDAMGMGAYTRDIAFAINTDQTKMDSRTQGLTYSGNEHDRFASSTLSDFIAYNNKKYGDYYRYLNFKNSTGNDISADTWKGNACVVEQVNSGAITEYPYRLSKTLNVASTHAQYYQLDLESDKDGDGEGDIVVWYTLNSSQSGTKDDIYDLSPNDVRNNYYIYNCGNITYTGMGHSNIESEEEIKLFINTMVAAYRVSIQSPKLNIIEGKGDDTEKSFDAIPVEEMIMNNENYYQLYFKAEDRNLISDGAKEIRVKVYVEGGADSIIIDADTIQVTDKTLDADWKVFDASGNLVNADTSGYYKLDGGQEYYVQIPLKEDNGNVVNLSELKSLDLYMEAQTVIYKKGKVIESAFVYDNFKLTQINLFDLD